MAETDGLVSFSATPEWPGTVSRRINGVWRRTPPEQRKTVVYESLQICFRNQGDGSEKRTMELAVMANGHRLESVELECASRPGRANQRLLPFSSSVASSNSPLVVKNIMQVLSCFFLPSD
jgi:hypothetical protein